MLLLEQLTLAEEAAGAGFMVGQMAETVVLVL
jgi:hypothetical protein